MDLQTGQSPKQRPRGRRESFRREIALAAVVVAVYAVVLGGSLVSLLGVNGAPDLLRLASDDEPVAEVLGEQSAEQPAAQGQQPTASEATPVPAEAAVPERRIVRVPDPGPTPEPVTANTQPPASVSGTHLVRSGDTLSGLSVIYDVDIGAIKLINGLDSDVIYTGQTLLVPRPDEASEIGVPRLGEGGMAGD